MRKLKKKLNIELFWNEFIYNKYNKLVKIDKKILQDKINKMKNESQEEYLLSEIVLLKKKTKK